MPPSPLWFDRRFELGMPPSAFRDVVKRLRGTPARLEDRLRALPTRLLTRRVEDRWSIQENVGHLLDLEPLWAGRVEDLLAGAKELRPADLTNRKTHQANHNGRQLEDILKAFRSARGVLVDRLESLDERALERTALHPRLKQPMNVTDLCYFVAEHDDHHLARVTEILDHPDQR